MAMRTLFHIGMALGALGSAITAMYSYDVITDDLELERCDARGHRESWDDMLRLQTNGTYPDRFARIESPVLMLHGVDDPIQSELGASSRSGRARASDISDYALFSTIILGVGDWFALRKEYPVRESLRVDAHALSADGR